MLIIDVSISHISKVFTQRKTISSRMDLNLMRCLPLITQRVTWARGFWSDPNPSSWPELRLRAESRRGMLRHFLCPTARNWQWTWHLVSAVCFPMIVCLAEPRFGIISLARRRKTINAPLNANSLGSKHQQWGRRIRARFKVYLAFSFCFVRLFACWPSKYLNIAHLNSLLILL